MMKVKLGSRKLVIIPVCVVLCLALPPALAAAAGGMPGVHEASGKEFGALVSDLAQMDPGAVAAHVGACDVDDDVDDMGGMPALHGVDGRIFGQMVSDLATSEPGAVAAHISECSVEDNATEGAVADSAPQGGIPAMHELAGKDFGAAVKVLAKSAPGAVADHICAPIPGE